MGLNEKKNASLKKAFKSGLDTDRLTYKGLRNKVIMQLRKAKAHFFLEIIREAKWNSKILWKSIDQLLGEKKPKSGSIQLKINCIIVNDNPAVATHFNNYLLDSVVDLGQHFLKKNTFLKSQLMNYLLLL